MTPTPKSPPSSTPAPDLVFLEAEDFDELDAILDELRTRYDETPQWEFCEGFMAAVICSRRPIAAAEYLPVLLAVPAEGEAPDPEGGSFADDTQRERFLTLWNRRWQEVETALDSEVDSLEDDNCYHPEVMDVRGAVADMPADDCDPIAFPTVGVGHPVSSVSDVRGTDARRRERDRPEGVTHGFHVSVYKVDPSICVFACNLLTKN